jgi:hypothetical protein
VKLPKRIADILKKKQEYIDSARSRMESSVIKQQNKLLSDIIAEIVPELDVKDGIIQDTTKNYRLISMLDKTYKSFNVGMINVMLPQIVISTGRIAKLSSDYFQIALTGDLPKMFDNIVQKTDKLINLKIGLEGGEMTRGGFLESFFNSNTIGTQLKDMTSKAVTGQVNMKDYVRSLRETISGVDEKAGALERQFQRYAFDLYQQYDAAYNLTLGNELGFNYFIYQGGLVDDSRDFCVAHNNKVWSKDEAKDWPEWTPVQGEYPEGYEVKAKNIYEVPSYMNYPGYDPLIDRGGYNCRHSIGWIADDLAFDMRPDLKE